MIIVQIAGHLGADPEVKFTPSGQKLTTFRIATNIKRGDKEKTQWWRVVVWGDRYDKFIAYLKKGGFVYVIGQMGIPEIYTDKSGNQQISLEVTAEMLSFGLGGKSGNKPQGTGDGSSEDENMSGATSQRGGFTDAPQFRPGNVAPGAGQANFADDDIPF